MQTVSKLFKALFLSDEHDYQMLKAGGARRDRTDDLLNANQALSQLSYGPLSLLFQSNSWWARVDLNHRPHAYQACALTS